MKHLIISCSLNPASKSRIMAEAALRLLEEKSAEVELLDLAEMEIPFCDGSAAYEHPVAQELGAKVKDADGILLAVPVYNYDINSAGKNLIELTGRAWTEKVVGFLCSAGGQGSYMSVMAVANSLMFDFRSIIIPRFVFATGDQFQGKEIAHEDLGGRIEKLTDELLRFTSALRGS